jgi:hypothetical protein
MLDRQNFLVPGCAGRCSLHCGAELDGRCCATERHHEAAVLSFDLVASVLSDVATNLRQAATTNHSLDLFVTNQAFKQLGHTRSAATETSLTKESRIDFVFFLHSKLHTVFFQCHTNKNTIVTSLPSTPGASVQLGVTCMKDFGSG